MKKIFISQPMKGQSDIEIRKERKRIIEKLYNIGYKPENTYIIDSTSHEVVPDNVNSALWYLGKSLQLLSSADIAVFANGWNEARGCLIEFECAIKYGIKRIEVL